MLPQSEADRLLALPKRLTECPKIDFPSSGSFLELDAESVDGNEKFIVDINRRGRIKLTKCTYQERFKVVEVLVRLDIDGPPHTNPDGVEMPCPHLHVYREGYGTKWAHPLPAGAFADPADLIRTLKDFLAYCNITGVPGHIQMSAL